MKKRILIVEDHYALAWEWKEVLEEQGEFEVDLALTAPEALPYLDRYRYDAFLLDLYHEVDGVFYGDGGLKLISSINKQYGPLATDKLVITVTGFHKAPSEFDAGSIVRSMGVRHFLRKPIDIDDIIDLINKELPNEVT